MPIQKRVTLVAGACVVLLISVGYTARMFRATASGSSKVLTQAQIETGTDAGRCSKIMWRSLCKDYGKYIVEQMGGLKQADLTCISTLCSDMGTDQCCTTIEALTNTMTGQTPGSLYIDAEKFNRLAALTGGKVAAVDPNDVEATKIHTYNKYAPKKKPTGPAPVVASPKVPQTKVEPKPWAAELGWDLDVNGHFNYSPGGKKADLEIVPKGCHSYAHVDLCFSPNSDSWVLGKTRNMKQENLQCIGYLCGNAIQEKCCGSLLAIKAAINGKNWMDLAEYEEHFDRLLRATGEYLE